MFVVSVLQAANGLAPGNRFQSRQQTQRQLATSPVPPSPPSTNGHDSILRNYHHHYHPAQSSTYYNGPILKPTSSFTNLSPNPSKDVWPTQTHYHPNNGSLNDLSLSTMSSKSVSLPGRYNNRGFRDTFVSAQTPSPLASANGQNSSPGRTINVKSAAHAQEPAHAQKEKKWTFGSLFKRKSKPSSSSPTPIPPSMLPAHLTRSERFINPNPIPKPARSHLEFSSELSSTDEESHFSPQIQSAAAPVQNSAKTPKSQITPQAPLQPAPAPKQNFLVRRLSKRKDKSKNSDDNGFLKVPLQNGRRVGSSPDSLNTGQTPWTPWQGWETTKKSLPVNYSSSSMEGSLKNSKTAAREAIKARAVARRESFFGSSSSEEDNGSSSLQGSHSSLSSRNRRKRHSRPELIRSSPNHQDRPNGQAPPSPRWEARIVYTQETLEQGDPVVIRLPNKNRPNFAGSDGLQETLVINNNSPYPPEDRTYANLPQVGLPMRGQSQSPFTVAPPPPPRDFRGNNFYRPVSCSYLDSYKQFESSPKIFAGSPKPFFIDSPKNFHDSPKIFASSPKHFEASTPFQDSYGNNMENSSSGFSRAFESPRGKFESPKHVFSQEVILEDNNPNGYDNVSAVVQSHGIAKAIYFDQPPKTPLKGSDNRPQPVGTFRSPSEPPEMKTPTKVQPRNAKTPGIEKPEEQAVSRLGFPIRKLLIANKLPVAQSPVHTRASEFWRKKEQEVTGVSPNPNQKRFLARIRSADSSPVPNMRNRISPNSNESISSLSSFSTEAPSPQWVQSKASSTSPNQRLPLRPQTLIFKQNPSARNPLSAVERLKRPPSQSSNPVDSRPESAQSQKKDSDSAQTPTPGQQKTSGKNLEDALNELEDMYKSLKLSDEDLLDRAERRDLPTQHQELRNAPNFNFSSPPGSLESLASPVNTGSTPSLGSSSIFGSESRLRTRAPPLRRSGRPDTVNDDMAKRRFEHLELKANDPRNVISQTGSYMLLSPAFSPPSSPTPVDPLAFDDPDVTADDLVFRNYKRANAARIIEPQPPFGIPLGPLSAAPASDYLHSEPKEKFRPIFRHTKRPDIVKDDIAFRNLRKDLNPDGANKDWTPRLFPGRIEMGLSPEGKPASNKKLRAIRSLSANITHLIPFKDSPVINEIGKWNSSSDLNTSPGSSSYLEPSWVEQIEKLQQSATSTETLAANERLIRRMQSSPNKEDSKNRRPWTDILLESFEKEKQEIERLNAQAEAAIKETFGEESGEDTEDVSIVKSTSFASASSIQSPDLEAAKPSPRLRRIKTSPDTSETTEEARSPVQNLFTPLPPPRKVHHIHLDSFGQSKQNSDASSKSDEKLGPPSPTPRKGEEELNDLIDALVRDADSCGAPEAPQKSSSETVKKDGAAASATFAQKSSETSADRYQKNAEESTKVSQKSTVTAKISEGPTKFSQRASEASQKTSVTTAKIAGKSFETANVSGRSSETSSQMSSQKISETCSKVPGPERRKSSISDLIDSINESLPEIDAAVEGEDPERKKLPDSSSSLASKSNEANSANVPGRSGQTGPVEGVGGGMMRKSNSSKVENVEDSDAAKVVLRKKPSKAPSTEIKPKDSGVRHAGDSPVKSEKTAPNNKEDLKKEKDKSSKRKSNLNRALTEEAAPVPEYLIENDPAVRRRSRTLSRPVSQEVSSLDSSSHDEPTPSKDSPGIYKAPQIPPILQNSVDNKFIKAPPPSSKIITSKIKVFETNKPSNKTNLAKKDSFSDAEGISSIKRLLQRESKKNPTVPSGAEGLPRKSVTPAAFSNPEPTPLLGVKKSPSASAFNWSRLSNTQPSFLRKFFEKDPKEKEVKETAEVAKTEEEEEVLALNVAQKASFFMKLEHEQRFSKWRRGSETPVLPGHVPGENGAEELTRAKQRFLTQPVNSAELEMAQNFSSARQTPSVMSNLGRDECNGNVLGVSTNVPKMFVESAAVGGVAWGAKSSYTDRDDTAPTQPVYQKTPAPEPSALSLKDRVIMFDRIQSRADSRPPSALKSKTFGFPPPTSFQYGPHFGTYPSQTPIRTPYDYNTDHERRSVFEEFSTPIGWMPPGTPYRNPELLSPLSEEKRRGSTSDVDLNTLRQMAQHGQFGPGFPPLYPAYKNCPPPPPPPINIPLSCNKHQGASQNKSMRVKSMFLMSGGSDAETHSEDGEVSSGGQEVAEIISRSYENSPMKKSWKSQKKVQPNLAKEIWQRCAQEDYNTDTNEVFYDAKSEFDEYTFQKFEAAQPTAPPPATSNLLPILTALSSSNDELDDSKCPIKTKSFRKTLESQTSVKTTEVRVHHPDDESFRTFFKSNRSNFPPICPTSGPHPTSLPFCDAHPPNSSRRPPESTLFKSTVPPDNPNPDAKDKPEDSFGSVKRESELLVMKKNVPLVRRKSSGKSKNPLKALAARMDFRNQKYTETQSRVDASSAQDESV